MALITVKSTHPLSRPSFSVPRYFFTYFTTGYLKPRFTTERRTEKRNDATGLSIFSLSKNTTKNMRTLIVFNYLLTSYVEPIIIIIIGFFINVQVQGPYPQQWAPSRQLACCTHGRSHTRSPGVSIMRVDS